MTERGLRNRRRTGFKNKKQITKQNELYGAGKKITPVDMMLCGVCMGVCCGFGFSVFLSLKQEVQS